MALRSRRRRRRRNRTVQPAPRYTTPNITIQPVIRRRSMALLRPYRSRVHTQILTKQSRLIRPRPARMSPRSILLRPRPVKVFLQRSVIPRRVLRRPTRQRAALVRAAQKKSSKRLNTCKCSEERSEAQREVTRKFIAGYGGRSNMVKKIGLCSCH